MGQIKINYWINRNDVLQIHPVKIDDFLKGIMEILDIEEELEERVLEISAL